MDDSVAPKDTDAVPANALQITVANDGDFVVQLVPESKPLFEKGTNAPPKRTRLVQFRVSREVLEQHSSFFQGIFSTRPDLHMATFENRGIGFGYAFEIWLRAIHGGAKSLPPNLKATHTERAWVAIGVGEQFGFAPQNLHKLKPWFIDCYEHALNNGPGLSPMTACCLAFPCSVFDHADGFMKLTKFLAFNTNGHIFTHNPSNFQHLNNDARVLDGPLTNARAHIQSTLDRELYFPLKKLHNADCDCRKETAFDYQEALIALDCWPIDRAVQRYPINEITAELEKFRFTPKVESCSSGACYHNFENSVKIAIKKTMAAFDGLCLDCMERSQCDKQPDDDFIKKNLPFRGCFDMNCRFGHGRTTWYFSWMGSLSVRRDILNKSRMEKRSSATTTTQGRRGVRSDKRSPPPEASFSTNNPSRESNPGIDQEGEDEEEYFDAEDDHTAAT
ncbi:unnamed protein product [Periconia digitata]|uniref:BTB domain-containing protein n=1 Tax=Periconia digitata TaxID=1303443 RepID=A0A9W4UM91_9PLEO|nr:unnamed protein product [Periconia digitata]